MPLIVAGSIFLQVVCLVHMSRTGRPQWWMYVIIFGSYAGALAYIVAELIPALMSSRGARRTVGQMLDRVDPERRRRQIETQLQIADTVANRQRLAEECLALGDAERAVMLFRSSLTGPHRDDAALLSGLARAQFAANDAAAARSTLKTLFTAQPQARSDDNRLLYARILEAQNDLDAALSEYADLADRWTGEEARVRYAELLLRRGRGDEARRGLEQVLTRTRIAPRHYRRMQRAWIERARMLLKT